MQVSILECKYILAKKVRGFVNADMRKVHLLKPEREFAHEESPPQANRDLAGGLSQDQSHSSGHLPKNA